MSLSSVINDIVDEKILNTSTAFIGKIISFNQEKKTANVQPLSMTKAYGKEAKQRAMLSGIPVMNNACYKQTFEYINIEGYGYKWLSVREFIKAGDLVVCVVCDRDISEARKGNVALPSLGSHEIQNSIVVGVL